MKYILPVFSVLLICLLIYKMPFAEGITQTSSEDKYIKINIGELYLILNDDRLAPLREKDYVFRGRVYLDSGLRQNGYFGVLRVAMICCAADTVAAGFQIPLEYLPEGTANGSWINVYGRLNRLNDNKEWETDLNDKSSRSMSGAPQVVSVRNDFIFLPDKLEETEGPQDGYMYKWNTKPPYNF